MRRTADNEAPDSEPPTAAGRGGHWLRGCSSTGTLNPNAESGSLHSLRGALGTGSSEVMCHAPVQGRSMVARTAREVAANAAANRAVLDDRRHNPPPRMTQAVRSKRS
jgi:hypothetical protein